MVNKDNNCTKSYGPAWPLSINSQYYIRDMIARFKFNMSCNHILENANKRNLCMLIEYDGSGYHGWQRQPDCITIQESIETGLERMLCHPVTLKASGRTDAGVHALGQVANFKTESKISVGDMCNGINSLIPDDIIIHAICETDYKFHSQFSAKKKTYEYFISRLPSAISRAYTWQITSLLDIEAIEKALQYLVATLDFSSFCSGGALSKNCIRNMSDAKLFKEGDLICLRFTANGFLKYQVRSIVGTLIDVGKKKITPLEFWDIIEAKDRSCAGITAPARGLFLKGVEYASVSP